MPLDYKRGPDKVWVQGALCVRDGQVLTQTASGRNTTTYRAFLETIDYASPQGDLSLVADNLSSHSSGPIREWLAAHPRIHHAFIPVGAAWLNLIEGRWRILGGSSAAKPSLDNRSSTSTIVSTSPAQRLPNSTGTPSPGSGAAHRRCPATFVVVLLSLLRNDALMRRFTSMVRHSRVALCVNAVGARRSQHLGRRRQQEVLTR